MSIKAKIMDYGAACFGGREPEVRLKREILINTYVELTEALQNLLDGSPDAEIKARELLSKLI